LVPQTTKEELEEAVRTAQEAFKTWKKTSIISRQQKMFILQNLIKRDMVGEQLDSNSIQIYFRIKFQISSPLNWERQKPMPVEMFSGAFKSWNMHVPLLP